MIEPTRYSRVRTLPLDDWRTWLDGVQDRYTADGVPLGTWQTLDARAVAATYRVPILGALLRLAMALLGSNRYEPYPIGNREAVNTLWADRPPWVRWALWHYWRNPWVDLRKFYLGFAYALDVDHRAHAWGRIHWARFAGLPVRVPFPELRLGWIRAGWKPQGMIAAGIGRLNRW